MHFQSVALFLTSVIAVALATPFWLPVSTPSDPLLHISDHHSSLSSQWPRATGDVRNLNLVLNNQYEADAQKKAEAPRHDVAKHAFLHHTQSNHHLSLL